MNDGLIGACMYIHDDDGFGQDCIRKEERETMEQQGRKKGIGKDADDNDVT